MHNTTLAPSTAKSNVGETFPVSPLPQETFPVDLMKPSCEEGESLSPKISYCFMFNFSYKQQNEILKPN